MPPVEEARTILSLRGRRPVLHWGVLLTATIFFIWLLELIHLPAALLLGAMAAAILVASADGRVTVPAWPYLLAQGLVGCLIARSIGPGILVTMLQQWPIFLLSITAVIVFSTALGIILARWKVLPGATAVWGSAPGAATVMTLMAEAFGGDVRLVAFMQYLRVVFVALVASVVSRLWVSPGTGALPATVWFPETAAGPFVATLALAAFGAFAGTRLKIPAGPLLVPLFLGVALSGAHIVTITLPPWLLAICYTLVGWTIGLRFTRDIVLHAARAFPQVAASILALIALCGGLAYVLHLVTGTDALTAYLATSPGGADSIAIIAASTKVDMPFVVAMQTGRFLLVLFIGPSLARLVARWTLRNSPA
jgi:membrane AbrB-like protein